MLHDDSRFLGFAARVKLSEHLPAPAEQGGRPIPAIGVVEMTRSYRRAGVRGTTRPQFAGCLLGFRPQACGAQARARAPMETGMRRLVSFAC